MFIILFLLYKTITSDSRVYCNTLHSLPWTSYGYSCPITCVTVLAAIDQLKHNDHHNLIHNNIRNNITITYEDFINVTILMEKSVFDVLRTKRNMEKNHELYQFYRTLFEDENFAKAFKQVISKWAILFAKSQLFLNKTDHILKAGDTAKSNSKAGQQELRNWFLEKLTQLLDKYTDNDHVINEQSALLLLSQIDKESSYNTEIVKQLLFQLLTSLNISAEIKNMFISLKPSHCLTILVPGCYCDVGYVEKSGECVSPVECLSNPMYNEYLDRIILH